MSAVLSFVSGQTHNDDNDDDDDEAYVGLAHSLSSFITPEGSITQ